MTHKKAFHTRLREAMRRQKMSQTRLAALVGVSRSAVARWLAGAQPPQARVFWDIADALQTNANYLLGKGENHGPRAFLDDDERVLLSAFRQLNPAGKQSILEMIAEVKALNEKVKPSPP